MVCFKLRRNPSNIILETTNLNHTFVLSPKVMRSPRSSGPSLRDGECLNKMSL